MVNHDNLRIADSVFLSGYTPVSSVLNRIFNFLLALILIIISSPIFFILYLIIKIQDGGTVFYRGMRLGLNKTPFIMYKFRTLVQDAEGRIGAELLALKNNLETPLGKFLRNTRLDELPQLFNILKGDMDFLGPRPERPAIYEKYCKNINGYDKRFSVKPGLIGYSQLFTPHNTPKKIRTLIDNSFIKRKQSFLWVCTIVVYTILIVLKTVFLRITGSILNGVIKSMVLGMFKEKRDLKRIRLEKAMVYIGTKGDSHKIGKFTGYARLVDINDDAFLIYTNHKISRDETYFKLEMTKNHGFIEKRVKIKLALCYGKVYREYEIKDNQYGYAYVIKYVAVSPFNAYMIDQYFLDKSMISPL